MNWIIGFEKNYLRFLKLFSLNVMINIFLYSTETVGLTLFEWVGNITVSSWSTDSWSVRSSGILRSCIMNFLTCCWYLLLFQCWYVEYERPASNFWRMNALKRLRNGLNIAQSLTSTLAFLVYECLTFLGLTDLLVSLRLIFSLLLSWLSSIDVWLWAFGAKAIVVSWFS